MDINGTQAPTNIYFNANTNMRRVNVPSTQMYYCSVQQGAVKSHTESQIITNEHCCMYTFWNICSRIYVNQQHAFV